MRIAPYLRVSTEDQKERQTVELQRDHAERWADLNGHEITGWYVDQEVSGIRPIASRPEGECLLRDAAAKRFDAVVVYRLDRWGRAQKVIHDGLDALDRFGVGFVSMTESFDTTTPAGKAMLGMLATFAGFERDSIQQRCGAGIARVAKLGRYLGGVVPYGYYVAEGFLQIDTAPLSGLSLSESDVVGLIFTWALEGLTCWKIAERLDSMGIPTPVGSAGEGKTRKNSEQTRGDWPPETVRSILRNPTYTGVRHYGKSKTKNGKRIDTLPEERIEQQVPAMISREVFEAVGRGLTRNQTCADRNAKHPHLLRGLIRCDHCGFTFISAAKGAAGGNVHRFYICNGRNSPKRTYGPGSAPCPAPRVRAEEIEADLWETLLSHLRDAEGTLLKLRERQGTQQQRSEMLAEKQADIRQAMKRNEDARRRVIDLMSDGIVTRTEGAEKMQQLREEGEVLQQQANELSQQKSSAAAMDTRLQEAGRLVRDWRDRINSLDSSLTFEEKRRCVEVFVAGITIREVDGEAVAKYRLCFNAAETDMV